jgi:hypothetical protein
MTDLKISPVNVDLTPLVSSTPKGISKIFDLLFFKKLQNNKRAEMLANAQTEKDIELIKSGLAEYRADSLILTTDSEKNPLTVSNSLVYQQQMIENKNVARCLEEALDYLEQTVDSDVDDTPVSETFFNKWFNFSKEVSDVELQNLWGRLLSEEVKTPESINYLVLNTFSLMTKKHLESFVSLIPYTAFGWLIFYDDKIPAHQRFECVSTQELQELQDLKIIKEINPNLSTSYPLKHCLYDNKKVYYFSKSYSGDYVLYLHANNDNEIGVTAYALTSIGQKLLEISEKNLDVKSGCILFAKKLLSFERLNHVNRIEIKRREDDGNYTFIENIVR